VVALVEVVVILSLFLLICLFNADTKLTQFTKRSFYSFIYSSNTYECYEYTYTEHLVPVRPSSQHVHATLAQSIRIVVLGTEHNVDGMIPVNCVLLNKLR
jgi:hypothetical protein